jgi:hypothetical protein
MYIVFTYTAGVGCYIRFLSSFFQSVCLMGAFGLFNFIVIWRLGGVVTLFCGFLLVLCCIFIHYCNFVVSCEVIYITFLFLLCKYNYSFIFCLLLL